MWVEWRDAVQLGSDGIGACGVAQRKKRKQQQQAGGVSLENAWSVQGASEQAHAEGWQEAPLPRGQGTQARGIRGAGRTAKEDCRVDCQGAAAWAGGSYAYAFSGARAPGQSGSRRDSQPSGSRRWVQDCIASSPVEE